MSGVLGRIDILPPEAMDVIEESMSSAVDNAMTDLRKKEIIPAGQPHGYHGEMPPDLSSLDDMQLGDLLNRLSQWCGFLDSELTIASARKKQAETKLEKVRARVRLSYKVDSDGKKLTDADKNDHVEVDPRVVEASYQEIYAYTRYVGVRGVRDEAQKNWETVSRRITQRGQEVQRIRRDVNVGNTPLAGRTFRRRDPT